MPHANPLETAQKADIFDARRRKSHGDGVSKCLDGRDNRGNVCCHRNSLRIFRCIFEINRSRHEIHSEIHSKNKSGRYDECHDVAIRSIDGDGNNVETAADLRLDWMKIKHLEEAGERAGGTNLHLKEMMTR